MSRSNRVTTGNPCSHAEKLYQIQVRRTLNKKTIHRISLISHIKENAQTSTHQGDWIISFSSTRWTRTKSISRRSGSTGRTISFYCALSRSSPHSTSMCRKALLYSTIQKLYYMMGAPTHGSKWSLRRKQSSRFSGHLSKIDKKRTRCGWCRRS